MQCAHCTVCWCGLTTTDCIFDVGLIRVRETLDFISNDWLAVTMTHIRVRHLIPTTVVFFGPVGRIKRQSWICHSLTEHIMSLEWINNHTFTLQFYIHVSETLVKCTYCPTKAVDGFKWTHPYVEEIR